MLRCGLLTDRGCSGTVTTRPRSGRLLGTARWTALPGQRRGITVPLPARRVRSPRRATPRIAFVRLTVAVVDGAGRRATARTPATLRLPGFLGDDRTHDRAVADRRAGGIDARRFACAGGDRRRVVPVRLVGRCPVRVRGVLGAGSDEPRSRRSAQPAADDGDASAALLRRVCGHPGQGLQARTEPRVSGARDRVFPSYRIGDASGGPRIAVAFTAPGTLEIRSATVQGVEFLSAPMLRPPRSTRIWLPAAPGQPPTPRPPPICRAAA